MGINELVAGIKAGNDDLYLELWQKVERLVASKAIIFANKTGKESYIDDMMQESFLILPEVVACYSEGCGKSFTSILTNWFLPKAFMIACYGSRSSATFKKPLNRYTSLDQPISDESDITLMETLVDDTSLLPFEEIENDSYWSDVRQYIQQGINKLKKENERDLIRFCYENDKSVSEAHRQKVIGDKSRSWYGAVYKSGIKNLRKWMKKEGFEDAKKSGIDIMFDLNSSAFYASGIASYRNHVFTSNVERLAIKNL